MDKLMEQIVNTNLKIFEVNPIIEKNICFTNTIYIVNNYIVKVRINITYQENYKKQTKLIVSNNHYLSIKIVDKNNI